MDVKNYAVVILVVLHLQWSLAAETREEIWKEFSGDATSEKRNPVRFQIVSNNWEEVEKPYTIAVWLLLASIAKIVFHISKKISDVFPDSSLLIIVGLVLGVGLKLYHVDDSLFTLESTAFFLYLLPPIIFDAGYFMPNRALFENFGSVISFAVIGTIWNTFAIGTSLYALGEYGIFSVQFSIFEIFLFSALISAVDPVAVIAVFEEIHVNELLFITVFGEALFNDGITVVLYQMFKKFTLIGADKLITIDYIAGGVSFFVIGLGGAAIGLVYAIIVSFITKYTEKVKVLNPIFIFVIPYLAYLTAELFGLSSIMAIVACGMAMKQYVKGNISHTAIASVKYFTKMLAQACETVIFMFLGLSTISSHHHWDLPFIALTLVFCMVYRSVGVIVQCAILNRFRKRQFSIVDQFVMAYGGLRGAIAFGLVVSMPEQIQAKSMFTTACIAVIYFTVFLQGMTIRPLVNYLKIEREDQEGPTMIQSVYMRYFDYTMAGVEDIAGQKGHNSVRDTFERLNATILRPLLMRNEKRRCFDASKIVRAYTKITLKEAMEVAKGGKRFTNSDGTPKRTRSAIERATRTAYDNASYQSDEGATTSIGRREAALKNELHKYMSSEENTEALYLMFSQLLDRKLRELNASPRVDDDGSDIEDDYMQEIIGPVVSTSTTNIPEQGRQNVRNESRSLANVHSVDLEMGRRPPVSRSHSVGQVTKTIL
uniref:Sodium/hydrogen exchanger n=2 Tax=Parascaris univalens TaxID=6257 RepID=A0A915AB50_PARUN